jgi:hypothetical protein
VTEDRRRWVGPVLEVGPLADVLVAVLREQNPELVVTDRGSYVRALSPERCQMGVRAVEERLGGSLTLPGDLERIMPAFQGALSFTEDGVTWAARRKEP